MSRFALRCRLKSLGTIANAKQHFAIPTSPPKAKANRIAYAALEVERLRRRKCRSKSVC